MSIEDMEKACEIQADEDWTEQVRRAFRPHAKGCKCISCLHDIIERQAEQLKTKAVDDIETAAKMLQSGQRRVVWKVWKFSYLPEPNVFKFRMELADPEQALKGKP